MPGERTDVTIHSTADVSDEASIGAGTRIWSHVQVRPNARIGRNCSIGRNVYVGLDVVVGDNVKVQNNASLYEGVELADGVFVGPHVVFTNDKVPRAVNPDGTVKTAADWHLGRITVDIGAAIGAGAVLITGVHVGRWAIVGSGAVVARDVPDHALVVGNPARVVGWVSATGQRCRDQRSAADHTIAEQLGSTP